MKTSVIDVRAMLSVLSVAAVEERIGEVPGVESVTVNFAAASATVRYDETRLAVADIKSAVRQRAHQSDAAAATAAPAAPESAPDPAVADQAVPVSPTAPPAADEDRGQAEPGVLDKATAWVRDTFAGKDKDQAPSEAPPAGAAANAEPKAAAPEAADATAKAPSAKGHEGHAAGGAQPAMSGDMAHEMGHGGSDLGAMVRDMRNRFWICLVFTIPIFIYAPMGGMWQAPAPPFGLELNLWLFLFASAAILYPSWPFFVSAWRAFKKGTLGMAALIVLSVGTGYLFSVGSTFFFEGEGQFFEAAAVLLVFILLGHWLEMRARAGASSAIKALMDLTPTKANVIRNAPRSKYRRRRFWPARFS